MGGKTQLQLEKEDKERDAAFNKAMHGKTAAQANSVATILFKNPEAKQAALDAYFKHFDNKKADDETDADRKARTDEYATLTRHYYNLATDIYEFGWGQSFHFCRFSVGEPFYQAIARHEHYLAHQIGIQEGMQVLDVGCGVGGPAREIAKFTGANITGLNNNDYQIDRAIHYAEKEKLAKQLTYVKGDFMQMPFPDNTFDAVYAIEATVHAPKLEGVYSEIFRVLKPGGVFGVYEWLMTDDYDNSNAEHRKIRLAIELGNGISNMVPIQEGLDAMKASGFDLLKNEDLAQRPDPMPWYWPLSGELKYLQSAGDFFTIFRMTKFGQFFTHGFAGLMETLRIAPKGTQKTANALSEGADGLVAGARLNLFTPMYLMVGRKPSN